MITIRISLSWVHPPPRRNLTTGLQHIAEIMPHFLDRHALSQEQESDSVPPAIAPEATDLFDVAIS